MEFKEGKLEVKRSPKRGIRAGEWWAAGRQGPQAVVGVWKCLVGSGGFWSPLGLSPPPPESRGYFSTLDLQTSRQTTSLSKNTPIPPAPFHTRTYVLGFQQQQTLKKKKAPGATCSRWGLVGWVGEGLDDLWEEGGKELGRRLKITQSQEWRVGKA